MITAELILTARSAVHWDILQETVASIAPTAQAIKSVGDDGTCRIHLSRGQTAPRDWRRALSTLALLADEGEP